MKSKPARYLLRFDDLCPTMSKARFDRFLRIVEQHQLHPILAVVPDNQDPDLIRDDADPGFWKRIGALQSAGATVAMHGYQHLCLSTGKSLVDLHRQSEFAGLPEETQRSWIRSGLKIFRERGLCPQLFVAPRHGFDSVTLRALAEEGLPFLSDGFASRPFTRAGVVCIPQQLWAPMEKPYGLWTICMHTNTATDDLERNLERFVSEHGDQFTSFDEVIAGERPAELSLTEQIRQSVSIRRRAHLTP
jgi:predicted deacetylase